MSDSETNKAAVRRFFEEAWNRGNLGVLDEIFAPDAIDHGPHNPFPELRGAENAKQVVSAYRAAFPDTTFTVEEMIADGDLIASRWIAEGTHRGEVMGIAPTDRRATVRGISMARFEDGRIVEGWNFWDALGMLQQLGLDVTVASQ